MLIDKILKFYDKKYDLNCAETILYAGNEEYNLNLSENVFKTMAGFGGGMCCEGVCGALTGGIALISILFTEERGHKSPKVKELTKELYKEFVYRLGSDNCKVLKDTYRTEAERCKKMVLVVGDILDNLIV
ncbi:MAG: C-GCAxxG-C-C family protein [Oscillospiraceae bacterium]|nr:C-GCAxxG-C-C family protein [Oscillospiraceae bacterium]